MKLFVYKLATCSNRQEAIKRVKQWQMFTPWVPVLEKATVTVKKWQLFIWGANTGRRQQ
jgi:hypothetical protein